MSDGNALDPQRSSPDVLCGHSGLPGSVEVSSDVAEELLRAADQYMMERLKRLCEKAIGETLSVENLPSVYELADNFNAPQLARQCVLFCLEHHQAMVRRAERDSWLVGPPCRCMHPAVVLPASRWVVSAGEVALRGGHGRVQSCAIALGKGRQRRFL
jgi:hypothetical protein